MLRLTCEGLQGVLRLHVGLQGWGRAYCADFVARPAPVTFDCTNSGTHQTPPPQTTTCRDRNRYPPLLFQPAPATLPPSQVRKLRALQRAVALFDRIATLPRQGRLSEVELRLFLAAQGCGSVEVDKVVRLVRSLVRTDKLDFVTFWDFVCAYDWIAQAFRIYAIPA